MVSAAMQRRQEPDRLVRSILATNLCYTHVIHFVLRAVLCGPPENRHRVDFLLLRFFAKQVMKKPSMVCAKKPEIRKAQPPTRSALPARTEKRKPRAMNRPGPPTYSLCHLRLFGSGEETLLTRTERLTVHSDRRRCSCIVNMAGRDLLRVSRFVFAKYLHGSITKMS